MGHLKTDLEAAGFELIETHISWVFLGPSDVFKVKRPVNLGFLDFTSLPQRRKACDAELRLNRRLASDVYLDVVPITRDELGVHAIDGEGEVVDWAVHMRRLAVDRRADALLQSDLLESQQVDDLAAYIARFHERARCDAETSHHGEPDMIRRNVIENFEQTRSSIGDYLSPQQAQAIETWQVATLADAPRFKARVESGSLSIWRCLRGHRFPVDGSRLARACRPRRALSRPLRARVE
jgi:hypothetical protein